MSWYNNPVGALSGFLGQQVPVQPGGAPTLNSDEANNDNYQTELMNHAAQTRAQMQGTYAGQNQLAGSLNNTINNPNASSVALSQLGSGFSQIAGTQLAGAAGASGENAAMAKRAAMQNIAGAQVGMNAQQAQLRAQEVANAQTGLNSLYSTQLGAENTTAGQQLNAANAYANTNEQGQSTIANDNSQAQQANAKANSNLLGTLGGAASAIAGLL